MLKIFISLGYLLLPQSNPGDSQMPVTIGITLVFNSPEAMQVKNYSKLGLNFK